MAQSPANRGTEGEGDADNGQDDGKDPMCIRRLRSLLPCNPCD
eukprot:CAMPEP_0185775312 /NCGR_PEP_ID=MMETSP1174-20130828/81611_1 /TAXON_ID=35687 /ORGANISM="Dictyocha speculum, Strain CCMP1381" /LENGTH=42 /DNA_ID= /DNA_START= /DNA_END= /DNA_ORIENTATION=